MPTPPFPYTKTGDLGRLSQPKPRDYVDYMLSHPLNGSLHQPPPVNMEKPLDIEDAFKARLEDNLPNPPVEQIKIEPPAELMRHPPVDFDAPEDDPFRMPPPAQIKIEPPVELMRPKPYSTPVHHTGRNGQPLANGPRVAVDRRTAEHMDRRDTYMGQGMGMYEATQRAARDMARAHFADYDAGVAARAAARNAPPDKQPAPEQNPEPLHDKMGRPSLKGEPAAPSAKVTGIDGSNQFAETTDEFRRKQFAKRIIAQHGIGPDASGHLLDSRSPYGTLDNLRALQEKLRADEAARRNSAFRDRIANEQIGRDLRIGHDRAAGMYIRSLARAAGENNPMAMMGINQGIGNNVAAGQNRDVAMQNNAIRSQDENRDKDRSLLGAQMQSQADQLAQQTPAGRGAEAQRGRNEAMKKDGEDRLVELDGINGAMGVQDPAQQRVASLGASAAYEAQRGNLNHPHVAEYIRRKNMGRDDIRAWLRSTARYPQTGTALTPPDLDARALELLSPGYRAGVAVYDALGNLISGGRQQGR